MVGVVGVREAYPLLTGLIRCEVIFVTAGCFARLTELWSSTALNLRFSNSFGVSVNKYFGFALMSIISLELTSLWNYSYNEIAQNTRTYVLCIYLTRGHPWTLYMTTNSWPTFLPTHNYLWDVFSPWIHHLWPLARDYWLVPTYYFFGIYKAF